MAQVKSNGARYVYWAEQDSEAFFQARAGNRNRERRWFAEVVVPDENYGMTFFTVMVVGNDVTPPQAPRQAVEVHGAQNDTWQRAVRDPAFTWEAAQDNPGGDGVDGYYVYWGPNPQGASSAYQQTTSYDPGAVLAGTYYLRVRVKDKAGNLSPWTTLFVFRYDNVQPLNPDQVQVRWQEGRPRFWWSGAEDWDGDETHR